MPRIALVLVALVAFAGRPAAQPFQADRVPASEAAFQDGLAAYRAGDYAAAERLFTRAATDYGFTERTTAATLMAARAAYADGAFDRAASAATRLVTSYPASRYAADARGLLPRIAAASEGQVFDLGIVLPVTGEEGYFGQALFNGVRIAVDEHNARVMGGAGRRVRMVFRDTRGTGPGAEAAVRAAVEAGADAVVGPLFSAEAEPAGAAAEALGVTLLAPLATDQSVGQGRRFVFQANPTFPARGRAMARYAVGRLGLNRLGAASESGTLSADMAGAFATEARRLGATVAFEEGLASAGAWEDLDREVGEAALRSVQAVYLPVTGRDAPRYASDALRSLDALGSLGRTPRPLGNTEWEGLAPSAAARATRLGAVFTQDFFVAPGAIDAFSARYQALSGIAADRLALIGYDLTRFVLAQSDGGEGALADRLRQAPRFDGIANRFAFDGGQVNEALFILGYRDGQAVLLE